jgi:hypothetical protein
MLHDKLQDMNNANKKYQTDLFGAAHVQGWETEAKGADESYLPKTSCLLYRNNHWIGLVVEVEYSEVQRKLVTVAERRIASQMFHWFPIQAYIYSPKRPLVVEDGRRYRFHQFLFYVATCIYHRLTAQGTFKFLALFEAVDTTVLYYFYMFKWNF